MFIGSGLRELRGHVRPYIAFQDLSAAFMASERAQIGASFHRGAGGSCLRKSDPLVEAIMFSATIAVIYSTQPGAMPAVAAVADGTCLASRLRVPAPIDFIEISGASGAFANPRFGALSTRQPKV